MGEKLEILDDGLLKEFEKRVSFDPLNELEKKSQEKLSVDYFQFYHSVSSVYSSKIEGENIDFDSFYKHKFLRVNYHPDYTKKADDLFNAYEFILKKELNEENVLIAHKILSENLLPQNDRGIYRKNPMFVINEQDKIEYEACQFEQIKSEIGKLFRDINQLKKKTLSTTEVFYFAAYIHLTYVKIHPMNDGNGRTARIIEKWFLIENLGSNAVSIELEKNYYLNRTDYYLNLRKIGLFYDELNYSKALDFLLMTILNLTKTKLT